MQARRCSRRSRIGRSFRALSRGLSGMRELRSGHDPGRVVRDLAVMFCDGARPGTRPCAWELGVAPARMTIDLDATLITAHSEKDEGHGQLQGRLLGFSRSWATAMRAARRSPACSDRVTGQRITWPTRSRSAKARSSRSRRSASRRSKSSCAPTPPGWRTS